MNNLNTSNAVNALLGQNVTNNTNNTANVGVMFSQLLQAKMNTSLASIGDFSDSSSGKSAGDPSSLYNLYGMNGMGGMSGLSGLSGMAGMSAGMSGLMGDSNMQTLSLLGGLFGNDRYAGLFGNSTGSSDLLGGMDVMTFVALLLAGSALSSNKNSFAQVQAANAYSGMTSALVQPAASAKEATGGITSSASNRSAALYNAVVAQFDVENHPRYAVYKNGAGDTYCNIYVWDVTKAMGAEVPHWVDSNGKIASSTTPGARELTANAMRDWLIGSEGQANGWKKVSAQEAQAYANQGCPAVAAWKNASGGHIQLVVPSPDGNYNPDKGAAISQAGSKLISAGYMSDVYSKTRLKDIEYFVHI